LGSAPKSNAAYRAAADAKALARSSGSLMPPMHILNAPTPLMRDLGYGRGYVYDHHAEDAFSGQNYFPETLERQRLYTPSDRGFEHEISARLAHWEKLRAERGGS
jgi:putative ATPase